jgi:hypothetical protein
MFITTQTLKYERREDDIATLAKVIDLLGREDVPAAIEVLMAYRNNLMESQMPKLKDYNQFEERLR